jgi:hypothetical protein
MKLLKLFTIYLFLSTNLFAQSASDKAMAWINSNMIDEHANCYVFYKISEEGLNRDTTKPKVNYANITDSLINKMSILGKQSSIKQETILAKIELSMKDLKIFPRFQKIITQLLSQNGNRRTHLEFRQSMLAHQ